MDSTSSWRETSWNFKEDASKQDAKVDAPVDKTAEAQESGKIAQLQKK